MFISGCKTPGQDGTPERIQDGQGWEVSVFLP